MTPAVPMAWLTTAPKRPRMRFGVQVDLLAQGIPFNFPDDGAVRTPQAPANLAAGASLRQKSGNQRAFFHVKLTVGHGGGSPGVWVGRTSHTTKRPPCPTRDQVVQLDVEFTPGIRGRRRE